jgi:hypothetical protein
MEKFCVAEESPSAAQLDAGCAEVGDASLAVWRAISSHGIALQSTASHPLKTAALPLLQWQNG